MKNLHKKIGNSVRGLHTRAKSHAQKHATRARHHSVRKVARNHHHLRHHSHFLIHWLELAMIFWLGLFSAIFAGGVGLPNNSSLAYPVIQVSTLDCRTQKRENLSPDCVIDIPRITNANFEKFEKSEPHRQIYTVLRAAPYDDSRDQGAGSHAGIDIASAQGTPVFSIAEWIVTFAGRQNGYGNVIKIKFLFAGHYLHATYAHLDRIDVQPGDRVGKSQQIGTIGNSGNTFGALGGYHLHFEITRDNHGRPAYSFAGCPELSRGHREIIQNGFCREQLFQRSFDPIRVLETQTLGKTKLPIAPRSFAEPDPDFGDAPRLDSSGEVLDEIQENLDEKIEENLDENSDKKSDKISDENPDTTTTDETTGENTENSPEKSPKNSDQTSDKISNKNPTQKPDTEKKSEKTPEKVLEKNSEKTPEKNWEIPTKKSPEKASEKNLTENALEKTEEKSEKTAEDSPEKTEEKSEKTSPTKTREITLPSDSTNEMAKLFLQNRKILLSGTSTRSTQKISLATGEPLTAELLITSRKNPNQKFRGLLPISIGFAASDTSVDINLSTIQLLSRDSVPLEISSIKKGEFTILLLIDGLPAEEKISLEIF